MHQRPSDRWLADAWEPRYRFRPALRILMVEHDGYVARSIVYQLEYAGYEVLACSQADEARELIEQVGLPHGAVVDLVAPGQAGDALCQWMHAFSDIPTIGLVPPDASEAWLQAIRAYTDAWLHKPFESRQLVRLMQQLIHELGVSNLPSAPLVQIDDRCAVDFVHQCILLGDHRVPLSARETKLLHLLMRRPGCVVSTAFLASRLERGRHPDETSEAMVHALVDALQQKFAAAQPSKRYIHVVSSVGYIFLPPQGG